MPAYRFARVLNQTRGSVVAARCRVAVGPLRRIFGLHLLPELTPGEGLLLPGTNSMDTMFMGYPIDVAFLDGGGRVKRVVPAMRPWRIVPWARAARDCLELPAGALAQTGTQPGDHLVFEDLSGTE